MATTWETIEERERRVRGTRTTSALIRAGEQIPGGDNLKAMFAERPFISRDELRNIARDHDEGPVITVYLNFAGERLVRDHPLFLTVFESLRHAELEARKPYIESLPYAHRLRVPEDLADLHAFLEGFEPEGARAIVIFKQGARLNRVMPLPVRVADSLTIDIDPYIEPLEAILEEQRRVLVVELSKEKTAVSVYELGYDEPVGAIKAFVPSDSVDASRPGKVQRHRLTHLQWHLKSSAQLSSRLFAEESAAGGVAAVSRRQPQSAASGARRRAGGRAKEGRGGGAGRAWLLQRTRPPGRRAGAGDRRRQPLPDAAALPR